MNSVDRLKYFFKSFKNTNTVVLIHCEITNRPKSCGSPFFLVNTRSKGNKESILNQIMGKTGVFRWKSLHMADTYSPLASNNVVSHPSPGIQVPIYQQSF